MHKHTQQFSLLQKKSHRMATRPFHSPHIVYIPSRFSSYTVQRRPPCFHSTWFCLEVNRPIYIIHINTYFPSVIAAAAATVLENWLLLFCCLKAPSFLDRRQDSADGYNNKKMVLSSPSISSLYKNFI